MVLSKDLKIAICFGLIIGVLFSFCTLCFASENVPVSSISYMTISSDGEVTPTAYATSVFYFEVEPGYKYDFYNVSQNGRTVGFSNEVVSGGYILQDISFVNGQSHYVFNGGTSNYVYFNCSFADISYVSITREPLEGMNGVIDNLAYTLSLNNAWQIVGFVVPIFGIAILLVLGFYLITRLINRIKHKKGGM